MISPVCVADNALWYPARAMNPLWRFVEPSVVHLRLIPQLLDQTGELNGIVQVDRGPTVAVLGIKLGRQGRVLFERGDRRLVGRGGSHCGFSFGAGEVEGWWWQPSPGLSELPHHRLPITSGGLSLLPQPERLGTVPLPFADRAIMELAEL